MTFLHGCCPPVPAIVASSITARPPAGYREDSEKGMQVHQGTAPSPALSAGLFISEVRNRGDRRPVHVHGAVAATIPAMTATAETAARAAHTALVESGDDPNCCEYTAFATIAPAVSIRVDQTRRPCGHTSTCEGRDLPRA